MASLLHPPQDPGVFLNILPSHNPPDELGSLHRYALRPND